MKASNKDILLCRCGKKLAILTTEDTEGNTGSVKVDFDGLDHSERSSLYMRIPVPYNEESHKKLIHFLRCGMNIPHCKRCGAKLAFFKTKPNPEKNGHNRPGSMPMDFYKITKEERYKFILGLPVQYEVFKHKDINHWANKECIDPAVKQYRKMKEKA